jgi:hypothetical protein
MEQRGSGLGLYSPETRQKWKVEIEEGDSMVGDFGKRRLRRLGEEDDDVVASVQA